MSELYKGYLITVEHSADRWRPAFSWCISEGVNDIDEGGAFTEIDALNAAKQAIDRLVFHSEPFFVFGIARIYLDGCVSNLFESRVMVRGTDDYTAAISAARRFPCGHIIGAWVATERPEITVSACGAWQLRALDPTNYNNFDLDDLEALRVTVVNVWN